MSRAAQAVGGVTATLAMAGITWKRLGRSRVLWTASGIAALPYLFAVVGKGAGARGNFGDAVWGVATMVMIVLAPLLLASAVSEELEEGTSAYLWSRPIARWTVLTGKLVVLVPVASLLITVGATAAMSAVDRAVTPELVTACVLMSIALCGCSAGIASIAPRHGTPIAIGYLFFIDFAMGNLPGFGTLSILHHGRQLVENAQIAASPIIGLLVLFLVWISVAVFRVTRME